MASGVEEMMAVLEEIKSEVTANPCNMGDVAMRAMASALRTLYRSKVPKRYSREMAARELGKHRASIVYFLSDHSDRIKQFKEEVLRHC